MFFNAEQWKLCGDIDSKKKRFRGKSVKGRVKTPEPKEGVKMKNKYSLFTSFDDLCII